jgi:hypothetical protein
LTDGRQPAVATDSPSRARRRRVLAMVHATLVIIFSFRYIVAWLSGLRER